MRTWEYCSLKADTIREATGEEVGELLRLTMPGKKAALVENAFGAVGLLNQLGGEGWEAVAESWPGKFERIVLLKRRLKD